MSTHLRLLREYRDRIARWLDSGKGDRAALERELLALDADIAEAEREAAR